MSATMRTAPITRVQLVVVQADAPLDTSLLREEHPGVEVQVAPTCDIHATAIDASAWLVSTDFGSFDDAVSTSRATTLCVRGERLVVPRVACEVLTRYQRLVDARNAASAVPRFDAVLRAHRELHDVDKPLVRADYEHALDTWQWMLRLAPDASLAAQLAALFHDVERLETEADRRVEHHAADYQAFKDAHAIAGAARAHDILVATGVDRTTAERARDIIAAHERRGRDADVDLLNDADALSFFSLNSAGYADYFGPEQTRRKIAYTLSRLGRAARARLSTCRLRPDVAQLLAREEAA